MSTYRIKYDHKINGSYIKFPQNKEEALRWIKKELE